MLCLFFFFSPKPPNDGRVPFCFSPRGNLATAAKSGGPVPTARPLMGVPRYRPYVLCIKQAADRKTNGEGRGNSANRSITTCKARRQEKEK